MADDKQGKVLRFKRPRVPTQTRLRFRRLELYEDGEISGHFSLALTPRAELRFSLDEMGALEGGVFAIYQTQDSITIIEQEDFATDAHSPQGALDAALPEAQRVLKEQLETWGSLEPSDKMQLQITWADDHIQELEARLRDLVRTLLPREHCGLLHDLLNEIESADHFRSGLYAALLAL